MKSLRSILTACLLVLILAVGQFSAAGSLRSLAADRNASGAPPLRAFISLTVTPPPTATPFTPRPAPDATLKAAAGAVSGFAPQPSPTIETPSRPEPTAAARPSLTQTTESWVAWAPDGKTVAVGWLTGIYVYDNQGAALIRYVGAGSQVAGLAYSPDGSELASGLAEGRVQLWRASDGAPIRTVGEEGARAESVTFAPDGATLAVGYEDGLVRLWRVTDGGLLATLEGHAAAVLSVAYSPDGKTLASTSRDGAVRLWGPGGGSPPVVLRTCCGEVGTVTFAPDGSVLAAGYGDGTVRLWRMTDATILRELTGHSRSVSSVAWSSDGTLMASGSADGTVQFWRIADGTLIDTLRSQSGAVTSVAFASSGLTLAVGAADGSLLLTQAQAPVGPGAAPEAAPTEPAASNSHELTAPVTAEGFDTGVKLSWQSAPGAQGYLIYRDGGPRPLNADPTTQTTFEDSGLTNGRTYTYTVAAVDAGGQVISHTVEITASPQAGQ